MGNRLPTQKALNTERTGSFNAGLTIGTPINPTDAGDRPVSHQQGGDAFNKGRLKPGTEVHHDASVDDKGNTSGQVSIPNNPGAFTGRDNASR